MESKQIKLATVFLLAIFSALQVTAQEIVYPKIDSSTKDPITDIPKTVEFKYGNHLIPDEETATTYAQIVLQKQYPYTEFSKLKPFKVELIGKEMIWDITVEHEVFNEKFTYYHVRINRNNGAILNFWADK